MSRLSELNVGAVVCDFATFRPGVDLKCRFVCFSDFDFVLFNLCCLV